MGGGSNVAQSMPGLAALQSMPGLASGGVVDMSILSTIAPPDAEAQQKYEAMGLPDPVAFAALTALGAVPHPAAMLDAMLTKARKYIEEAGVSAAPPVRLSHDGGTSARLPRDGGHDAVAARAPPIKLPPGKSFVEAFQEMHQTSAAVPAAAVPAPRDRDSARLEVERLEERLKTQVKEAAEQAKVVAAGNLSQVAMSLTQSQGGEVEAAAAASRARDVAQFFSTGDEDEIVERPHMPPARSNLPLPTTLSGLLSGAPATVEPPGAVASYAGVPDKICITGLPTDATSAAVRLECARHGAVTAVIVLPESGTAYVSFAAAEMAAQAARRLVGRKLGLTSKSFSEVRLISEFPPHARHAASAELPREEILDPTELPAHLRPREERKKPKRSRSRRRSNSQRSKSRKRGRSKARKKKKEAKSWLDRSRSNSHTATGQYIRATGCSSTVKWWEKKRPTSSSSSSSKNSSGKARRRGRRPDERRRGDEDPPLSSKQPRQVALKGSWAQFVYAGATYYHNIAYGFTTWERPSDFERSSKRQSDGQSKSTMLL